jgi:hypothetical protein
VGDSIVAERVKVTQFRSVVQLSSVHHSLYHFNIPLPQAESMRTEWQRKNQNIEIVSHLHSFQRAGVSNLIENPPPLQLESNPTPKKQRRRHQEVKSAQITDFFKPARTSAHPSTSSAQTSTPLDCSPFATNSQSIPPPFKPQDIRPTTECILGRFSVADAINLQANQSCWTVACLSEIVARTPRGWCIWNCMNCENAVSICVCTPSQRAFVWS